jgi:hypothetical protein
MERTAEEFVHRLPDGRWFVGDFVGRSSDGQEVFLVETPVFGLLAQIERETGRSANDRAGARRGRVAPTAIEGIARPGARRRDVQVFDVSLTLWAEAMATRP